MKTFNSFPRVDFDCDRCGKEFEEETAYSVANNWEEFNHYPTLCFPCWKVFRQEAKSQNLLKPDKRTLNKTGRIHQFGTRVRKEFLKKLKKLARQEKLKYVEVLERALDYYGERSKK